MGWRFNPPPGWPAPPPGFVPPQGWTPDPSWPAAPAQWQFWLPDQSEAPTGAGARHGAQPDGESASRGTGTAAAHLSWHDRRQAKHAAAEHAEEVTEWRAQQDLADELAAAARAAAAGTITLSGLLLKKGERGLWSAPASLVEPRVGQGHYVGGYSGVSLHVAKGVNYRIGGARGHYVPGPEVQTPVDSGRVFVTSQRVVFTGERATREWLFAKLVGADASSDDHAVLLHVSNRQKVSGLALGRLGARFQAYLALGLALAQQDPDAVARQWSEEAEANRARMP